MLNILISLNSLIGIIYQQMHLQNKILLITLIQPEIF
jgi:hypothetical protein